jgi:predicted negative regulator of RcsB-dependent stress response
MKRTERRHLKENEFAAMAAGARDALERRRREVGLILVAVIVVSAALIGYFTWRGRAESRAGAMLADAVTVAEARVGPPPAPGTPATGLSFPTEAEKQKAALEKFKAVADQYPSTDAGSFARYREAATQMALGNPKEAAAAYQQVIDADGDGVYGRMARLGLAEAQARSGQFDNAIETYRVLAEDKDGPLPVDGILMQLGRTYLEAGKTAEAQQTFNRVVEEFPESPFSGDARRELDSLKKS